MLIGEVNMRLTHLPCMRRDRQPEGADEMGYFNIFAVAAESGSVRLEIVDGTGRDKRPEGIEAVELLAERDWDRRGLSQLPVALDVIVPEWLLKPEDVESLRRSHETQACRQIPLAVAVDRNTHARPERPAHRLQPVQIDGRVVMTHL
jgi:hypothetical protein